MGVVAVVVVVAHLLAPAVHEAQHDVFVDDAGTVFAVDGGITLEGEFGARVGDTIIVTERGSECATEYPRDLTVL